MSGMSAVPSSKSSIFDHFERLIDLPAPERLVRLSELQGADARLAAELAALLEADSRSHALDVIEDGGGQRMFASLPLGAFDETRPQPPGYRLLSVLGEGGMGRVYLGERDVQGYPQRVAIKCIRPERASTQLQARFLAEQRHLAALDHPGICRFIEAGVLPDGGSFVVMEAIQGLELLTYCETVGLDLEQRVTLLRRLLDAVAHAHERLLIHRDLKPSNVLVTAEGQPKLLDFGISKSLAGSEIEATATSDRFFTLSATAPEQLLGEALGVGCDVYALGLIAYRMLCGQVAYDLSSLKPAEAEALILRRAPPTMSSVANVPWASRLRGDLDAIVLRCLRKRPSERYLNVREFDADLLRWQRRLPISSRESEWAYRSKLFLRRNAVQVVAFVLSCLVLSIGAAGFWAQANEVAAQRTKAIEERDLALHLSQILEEAFVQSDPARAGGEGVSVRAILEAVKIRLDRLEESNPRLFASLAASLARVELGLGADSAAADLSDRGLRALTDSEGETDLEFELLTIGAQALSRSGQVTEAGELLTQAQVLGDDRSWNWQYAKARNEMDARLYEDARARLTGLIALASAAQDERKAEAQRLLVEVLVLKGALDEALQIQGEMHAAAAARHGPDHASTLLEELELLRLKTHRDSADGAVSARFKTLLEALAKHYRADSPVMGGAYSAAARAYANEGKTDAAISAMRTSLSSFRSSLGIAHARTLRAHFNLAMALRGGGHIEESIQILEELRQLSLSHFSPVSGLAVRGVVQQSSMLALQGKREAALSLLKATEEALQGFPEDDSRRMFVAQAIKQTEVP